MGGCEGHVKTKKADAPGQTTGKAGTAAWSVGSAEADHGFLECPLDQETQPGSHRRWAVHGRMP